jgi:hypothetical protein
VNYSLGLKVGEAAERHKMGVTQEDKVSFPSNVGHTFKDVHGGFFIAAAIKKNFDVPHTQQATSGAIRGFVEDVSELKIHFNLVL